MSHTGRARTQSKAKGKGLQKQQEKQKPIEQSGMEYEESLIGGSNIPRSTTIDQAEKALQLYQQMSSMDKVINEAMSYSHDFTDLSLRYWQLIVECHKQGYNPSVLKPIILKNQYPEAPKDLKQVEESMNKYLSVNQNEFKRNAVEATFFNLTAANVVAVLVKFKQLGHTSVATRRADDLVLTFSHPKSPRNPAFKYSPNKAFFTHQTEDVPLRGFTILSERNRNLITGVYPPALFSFYPMKNTPTRNFVDVRDSLTPFMNPEKDDLKLAAVMETLAILPRALHSLVSKTFKNDIPTVLENSCDLTIISPEICSQATDAFMRRFLLAENQLTPAKANGDEHFIGLTELYNATKRKIEEKEEFIEDFVNLMVQCHKYVTNAAIEFENKSVIPEEQTMNPFEDLCANSEEYENPYHEFQEPLLPHNIIVKDIHFSSYDNIFNAFTKFRGSMDKLVDLHSSSSTLHSGPFNYLSHSSHMTILFDLAYRKHLHYLKHHGKETGGSKGPIVFAHSKFVPEKMKKKDPKHTDLMLVISRKSLSKRDPNHAPYKQILSYEGLAPVDLKETLGLRKPSELQNEQERMEEVTLQEKHVDPVKEKIPLLFLDKMDTNTAKDLIEVLCKSYGLTVALCGTPRYFGSTNSFFFGDGKTMNEKTHLLFFDIFDVETLSGLIYLKVRYLHPFDCPSFQNLLNDKQSASRNLANFCSKILHDIDFPRINGQSKQEEQQARSLYPAIYDKEFHDSAYLDRSYRDQKYAQVVDLFESHPQQFAPAFETDFLPYMEEIHEYLRRDRSLTFDMEDQQTRHTYNLAFFQQNFDYDLIKDVIVAPRMLLFLKAIKQIHTQGRIALSSEYSAPTEKLPSFEDLMEEDTVMEVDDDARPKTLMDHVHESMALFSDVLKSEKTEMNAFPRTRRKAVGKTSGRRPQVGPARSKDVRLNESPEDAKSKRKKTSSGVSSSQ